MIRGNKLYIPRQLVRAFRIQKTKIVCCNPILIGATTLGAPNSVELQVSGVLASKRGGGPEILSCNSFGAFLCWYCGHIQYPVGK